MVNSNSRRLADRYEIRSLIGRGGMAQVHLGFDTRLSRVVAIKILRSDMARDAVFQARFRREAQASASLNHPNIVGVYDTGEEMVVAADGATVGVPFIVMEYVEGHTVKELLADGTPVPISEAVEITSGVLSALEYSHGVGLVHRDIKPGNIMLTKEGKVKVMDFGIARAITDSQATMTGTNVVVGTAQYLSPEQARGEKVDARSDLYSTGCVLFELLTGQPPFKGDSAVSVAYQHVSEVPPAPSTIAGDIPESLDRVVLKAMAKDANQRYSSALAMQQDMLRAAQGLSVDAPATESWTAATTPMVPAALAATQMYDGTGASTATGTLAGIPGMDPNAEALEEEEPKKNRVWLIVLLVVLGLAIVGGVVYAFMSDRGQSGDGMVQVPSGLVGLSQEDARAKLDAVGLQMSVGDPVKSNEVAKDKVATVAPAEGSSVEEGGTVTVQLSSGADSVTIPDMSGWDQDRVLAKLKELGFERGAVKTADDPSKDAGGLIKTDPAMGSIQPYGTTVDMTFASGNATVPNLLGMKKQDALDALNKVGLTGNVTGSEMSEDYDEGQVMAQSKSSGTVVATGESIDLTISSGRSVPVPDVEGMSAQAAAAELADAGFKVATKEEFSEDVEANVVISYSPSGTQALGTKITLVISKGASPSPSPSPDPTTPAPDPDPTNNE